MDKMHDMFLQNLSLYAITGGPTERLKASAIFEECGKIVKNYVVDRIQAYALMWINSAERMEYVRKYVYAK